MTHDNFTCVARACRWIASSYQQTRSDRVGIGSSIGICAWDCRQLASQPLRLASKRRSAPSTHLINAATVQVGVFWGTSEGHPIDTFSRKNVFFLWKRWICVTLSFLVVIQSEQRREWPLEGPRSENRRWVLSVWRLGLDRDAFLCTMIAAVVCSGTSGAVIVSQEMPSVFACGTWSSISGEQAKLAVAVFLISSIADT